MQRVGTFMRALLARSLIRWVCLPVAAAAVVSTVLSQVAPPAPPSIPAISLATEPLYARGVRAKPTLTLALSVEFPTVGQAYPASDAYDTAKDYIGYFDPAGCYTYSDANKRFERTSSATAHACGGTLGFSGNFMNWASTSAIDILRYGLTGGDRVTDTATETVLQRAVIPTNFYNSTNFSSRSVSATVAAGAIPSVVLNGHTGDVYVANCLNRVFFGTQATGNCNSPGNNGNLGTNTSTTTTPTSNSGFTYCANENGTCSFSGTKQVIYGANSSYAVLVATTSIACNNATFGDPLSGTAKACYYRNVPTATSVPSNRTADAYYTARVAVCTASSGTLTDPRPDLCVRYPSGNYKPVGNLQKYSDRVRVAAFGYLRDDSNSRYGGVLRAPMKYVGPHAYDSDFNLISGANAAQEWDESTGVFTENPDASTEFAVSGVTNYLNRFGRTGAVGVYKTYDPVNELYYESLRYLQGLPPTPAAISGLTTGDAKKDGFPVYTTWTDPHPAITGLGTTGDYSCVKNNLLTIGDVNTHYDKQIPGFTGGDSNDSARPANPSGNEPDFKAWTNVVGGFESAGSVGYVDGNGSAQVTVNPNPGNTARANLQNQNPSDNSNYFMSGMAYWANTHDIRGTGWSDTAKRRPGMRMRTYIVDVNEYGAQTNVTTRHNNQFYMAAKYGGFRDESDKGNPFYKADGTVDNSIWQQGNGDAKTYFLAGDPVALLSSLDTIFEQIASEASSIAGGAITTQTLTASGGNIYQASFDPSDWSGDVISYTLGLNPDGSVALGTSQTAAWRAGAVLDARTAARNIIVGSKTTTASTAAGTDFLWNNLSTAQQNALQLPSAAASAPDPAASGAERVAYIRGDRTLESPAGPYRKRASLLGDIVNSGVVFKGAPTLGINDAGYASFYTSHSTRTPALYVGANDGMLHAFNGNTGEELFAYIPNFLVPNLNLLTSTTYSHQRSYVDATPVVAEANLGSSSTPSWKTVLVSGAGAGAQGVFALDVTNPASFTAASVLWEFTDADDSALGNVVGRPQIMKIRTSAASATTPTYKWFAVFASGVNNYVDDGHFSTTGKPAIFFLDLSKPVNADWSEGSNYFKVSFPQASTAVATGMLGFSATGGSGGELAQLYAGDLQGNLWKLDFATSPAANATAVDVSSLLGGTTATLDASNPLFIAVSGANLQPISMEPALLVGPNRSTIVSFGTGKFLESNDTNGSYSTQSVYAILDANAQTIPSRGRLSAVSQSASTGALTASAFAWGIPSSDADMSARAGWYLDFANSATSGERQISGMGVFGNQLIFGSVIPAQGGCDEGSGKLYAITQMSGVGSSATSTVGILGAPFILQVGGASVENSDSTGLRQRTTSGQVVLQGSSGLTTFNPPMTYIDMVGRLSWRQINNYQEIKAAP